MVIAAVLISASMSRSGSNLEYTLFIIPIPSYPLQFRVGFGILFKDFSHLLPEEQNEARQIEALKKHSIEKWFTEKVSGKSMDRPQLQAMLDYVREGDTVYIHDFSRLARSTKDLLEIVERLQAKEVHLVSNKENLDTGTPTGKLMLTMIAAINEFERQNLLDRQREGIAIAKRNGVYKGRKKVTIPDNFSALYDRYTRREMNKGQLAEALHVTRPTLKRMIREHLSAKNPQNS